jgi:DNA-directed RNA polymerase
VFFFLSLLQIWHASPLGERGLYWLLVHLATLFGGGIDKASFAARQAWSESHIADIRESVEKPLEGTRWWLQAEKPFQFLGACVELVKALRCPDPTKFMSTLPVHTDGSCNGLQHYAALGRDAWGGSCVNLTASDRPQDVYSRVLDTVRVKLAADAAQPSHSRSRTAAKLLQGGVNRKIVKQTVMTSVYGVTIIGARDQILARLQERADFVELFRPTGTMGEDDLHAAALYLAQLTLSSLFDAFAGARRIQDWLGDCAVRMAVVQQPVSWVTPLGLPVIQPYRQASLYTVQTAMQAVTIVDHSDLLPVSSIRQKSAFPPNFIHSLDASHMLMTAAECQRQGLTFASVHDSYWTHAGSMDTLSAALRQEFVHLYRQPILEQVRDAWVQRFPEIKFKEVPARGDLDIAEVLRSPYFFN